MHRHTTRRTLALGLLALCAACMHPLAGCMSRPYQGQALYSLDAGMHAPGRFNTPSAPDAADAHDATDATGAPRTPGAADATAGAAPPARSAAPALAPTHAGVLRVRDVAVASPYASPQFQYRYADGSMRSDPYASFIASPEALINRAVIARLAEEGLFTAVVGNDLPDVQAYELVVSIRTLGAVFNGPSGDARVVGTVFLLDPTASPVVILETFEISSSGPVTGEQAGAVAAGLNFALASWLTQLAHHLRTAALPPLSAAAADAAADASHTHARQATPATAAPATHP